MYKPDRYPIEKKQLLKLIKSQINNKKVVIEGTIWDMMIIKELAGKLFESNKYKLIYAQPNSVNDFVKRILKRFKKDLRDNTLLTSIIWKNDGEKMLEYYNNNRVKFNKILKTRAATKFSETHDDYIVFENEIFDIVEI
jgi:hypothetical protein